MDERSNPLINVRTLTLLTILMPVVLGLTWVRSGYSFSLLMMTVLMLSSLSLSWQAAIWKTPPVESRPPKWWEVTLAVAIFPACMGLVFIPDEYLPDWVLNTIIGSAVAVTVCAQIAFFLKMRRRIECGAPNADRPSQQNRRETIQPQMDPDQHR